MFRPSWISNCRLELESLIGGRSLKEVTDHAFSFLRRSNHAPASLRDTRQILTPSVHAGHVADLRLRGTVGPRNVPRSTDPANAAPAHRPARDACAATGGGPASSRRRRGCFRGSPAIHRPGARPPVDAAARTPIPAGTKPTAARSEEHTS